jgi:DNA (cytosine-5)-methyltransferase 1
LTEYLRVLRDTRPKAFLLENVPGLAYRGKSEGIDALQAGIEEINRDLGTNYVFEYRALNAVDYGVPQLRERVFIIGSRDGLRFQFPSPTHFRPDSAEALAGKDRHRTVWDAFADLAPIKDKAALRIKGKWADLLPSIPEGHNYLWHTDRGGGAALFGWRRRYWNFLLKLAKDRPSWTIQAQPGPATGPFHWENRRLSAEELCRLQTFPGGLRFDCGHAEIQKMVGNAVPSALAETLAREVAAQFFGVRGIIRTPTLAPSPQKIIPAPAKRLPIAKKFLHLVHSDSAHPGTGRGRGAIYRDSEAA